MLLRILEVPSRVANEFLGTSLRGARARAVVPPSRRACDVLSLFVSRLAENRHLSEHTIRLSLAMSRRRMLERYAYIRTHPKRGATSVWSTSNRQRQRPALTERGHKAAQSDATDPGSLSYPRERTSAPGVNRTPDLQIRSLPLYPTELRAQTTAASNQHPARSEIKAAVE